MERPRQGLVGRDLMKKRAAIFLLLLVAALAMRLALRRPQSLQALARQVQQPGRLPEAIGCLRLAWVQGGMVSDPGKSVASPEFSSLYSCSSKNTYVRLILGFGWRGDHMWSHSLLLHGGQLLSEHELRLPTREGLTWFDVALVRNPDGSVDSVAETECLAGACDMRAVPDFMRRWVHPASQPVSLVVDESFAADQQASTQAIEGFVSQLSPRRLTSFWQ